MYTLLKKNSINYFIIFSLLTPVYFYLRLNLLDSNGPFFYHPSTLDGLGHTEITTFDEFFYMSKAIFWSKYNLYNNYREYNLSTPFLFISNFFTYLSLKIIGLNFYGFRFPAVLSGFVIIFCFSKVIHQRFGLMASVFFIAYLIFDYHFTLASRTMNPNIFRLCLIGISIFIFYLFFENIDTNHKYKKSKIAIISFVLSFIVLFEYPSYIPIYIAWSFTVLATLSKSLKQLAEILLILILVFILSYILFILFLYYQNFYLDAVSRFIDSHQSRNPFDYPNPKKLLLLNLIRLREALFVLSFTKAHPIISYYYFLIPGLVFIIKVIFDYIIWLVMKSKKNFSKTDFFVAVLLGGTFIQYILLNDYHIKKPFILLPLSLYSICYVLNQIAKIFNNFFDYSSNKASIILLFCFYFIFSVTTFPYFLSKTNKYIFKEAKFTHKNAMLYLSKYDGKYFTGAAFEFSLYNKILPVSHHYLLNYSKSLDKNTDKFRAEWSNIHNFKIIYESPYANQLFDTEVNKSNWKKIVPMTKYDKLNYQPDEFIMCSYEKRYFPYFIGSKKNKILQSDNFKNISEKFESNYKQQSKNLKDKKNEYTLENYNECKYKGNEE